MASVLLFAKQCLPNNVCQASNGASCCMLPVGKFHILYIIYSITQCCCDFCWKTVFVLVCGNFCRNYYRANFFGRNMTRPSGKYAVCRNVVAEQFWIFVHARKPAPRQRWRVVESWRIVQVTQKVVVPADGVELLCKKFCKFGSKTLDNKRFADTTFGQLLP
jgi:hypothetical protein